MLTVGHFPVCRLYLAKVHLQSNVLVHFRRLGKTEYIAYLVMHLALFSFDTGYKLLPCHAICFIEGILIPLLP